MNSKFPDFHVENALTDSYSSVNLTSKNVNNFGYISITIMMALLLLLWLRIVPDSFAIPFLIIAAALFITRLVLRIRLIKLERKALHNNKRQASS